MTRGRKRMQPETDAVKPVEQAVRKEKVAPVEKADADDHPKKSRKKGDLPKDAEVDGSVIVMSREAFEALTPEEVDALCKDHLDRPFQGAGIDPVTNKVTI